MKDIIRAFKRISVNNRTIVYGVLSLLKYLVYFSFKVVVGFVFKTPLLIVLAIYDLLIGLVKANCSRGLLKNKDDLKDCKTYILGGAILFISSIFYIIYTANQVDNPYGIKFNLIITILIAGIAALKVAFSILGLTKIKGKTMLVKEFKITNCAIALTNVVLTQVAILSYLQTPNMQYYNSIFGVIIGIVILFLGLYLMINGAIHLKVHTTGITNAKPNKLNENKKSSE